MFNCWFSTCKIGKTLGFSSSLFVSFFLISDLYCLEPQNVFLPQNTFQLYHLPVPGCVLALSRCPLVAGGMLADYVNVCESPGEVTQKYLVFNVHILIHSSALWSLNMNVKDDSLEFIFFWVSPRQAMAVVQCEGSAGNMTQHRTCISCRQQNISKNWHKLFTFRIAEHRQPFPPTPFVTLIITQFFPVTTVQCLSLNMTVSLF